MSEQKRSIVIVGGVAAGMKTAVRVRRLDPHSQVIILDRGDKVSFGSCALPYYVEGLFDDLDEVRMTPTGVIRDETFFSRVKGVEVRICTEVLAIDREQKRVRVRDTRSGKEGAIAYDQLVLATGNRPVMPPVPGIDLEGVHPLKNMEDADRLAVAASLARKAVVVGGGLIGLEMAEALRARDIEVTLVELQEQVLANALDSGMAALVQRELRKNGVALRLADPLQRIEGENGRVTKVVTASGDLEADMVVMAVGVRPEAGLARAAGLEIGITGAIAVDEHLRTSDPDIFAAGDCAECVDLLSRKNVYVPLGSTANKHGRVVANNLCGRKETFPGILGSLIVKVFSLTAARTGLSFTEAKGCGYDPVSILVPCPDRVHAYPGAKPIVIKLLADRTSGKLLGAQIVGPGDVDKRIDVVATMLSLGGTVDQLAQCDLTYAPPYSAAMDPLHQAANALRNKLDGIGTSLDPAAVQQMCADGEDFLFLDVRAPSEHAQVRIPGATLLPLGMLREKIGELPRNKLIVPFCKLSLRGYEAQRILNGAGFSNVRFMEGGILGWPYELETGQQG